MTRAWLLLALAATSCSRAKAGIYNPPQGGISWPLTNGVSTNRYNSAVTDSAAAVGHLFTETNACATDGCVVFAIQSPTGSDWVSIGRVSGANKFSFFGDADGSGNGPFLIKSTSSSAGITLDATTAGGRIYQQYSTAGGLYLIADLTAGLNRWQVDPNGAWAPYVDGAVNLGLPTNRPAAVYTIRADSSRYTSPPQTMAHSATPAFDCAAGNRIHIGPVTANVTGPTMTAGAAGETCTITWLKDGTAGAFTISGWGANVRFNGAATFAVGANAIITQTFWWDDGLATDAWVLQSQQAAQ